MPIGVLSLGREAPSAAGREGELAALHRDHEEARAEGRARFAFVKGPPGVGKSHLLTLFRRAAAASGALVFEAGSAREARQPFGLFAGLTRALLDHVSHSGTEGATVAVLSRQLAPILGGAQVRAADGLQEQLRVELYDALAELFVLASPGAPIYLLPDLDAADPASLELFRFLAAVAGAPESRLSGLFVGSFRDDAPLPALLSEVLTRVSARTLSLSGLDLEGIRAYLARDAVAARLHEATGGLPSALEELLAQPAPAPVELSLRRAERHGALAAQVLGVLAVGREALPAAQLAGAVGRLAPFRTPELGPLAALIDALVRDRLLGVRVSDGEPVYRFARDADQHAFLAELGAGTVAYARALGEELREAGALVPAAQLLLEADPAGLGARTALAAADALAARGAHAEAAELYTRALPHLAAPALRATHLRLSELADAQGEHRRALVHLARARQRPGRSGPVVRSVGTSRGTTSRGGEDSSSSGQPASAQRLASEPARIGLTSLHLAASTGRSDRTWGQGGAAARVISPARAEPSVAEPGGHSLSDAALARRAARHLLKLGRLTFAERLLTFAEKAAPSEQADPGALATWVELLFLRGRPEEARALAQAKLPLVEKAHPLEAIALRNIVGRGQLQGGELALAAAAFSANHAAALALGLPALAAEAQVNLGVVAHKRGERERALFCYEAAAAAGRGPVKMRAHANLGSLYAESGPFELALDHLQRALQAFSRMGSQRDVAQAASNLARLTLFLGELDRSLELSSYALRVAGEVKDPYLEASALLNIGSARLDKGEAAEARQALEDARRGFEQVGSASFAAFASALKARAHLALGERAQAAAELSRPAVEEGARALSASAIEVELTRGELALALSDLSGAGRAVARAREALLSQPELEGPFRVHLLAGRLRQAAGDAPGAAAELARAGRLLDELVARVPLAHRPRFLAVPRRAEVLAGAPTELRLPPVAPAPAAAPDVLHGLVGRSPALATVVKQLPPIARSSATVLVRGESGTGKELIADAIHHLSARRQMPLVKVNCAAMVEELLLSELFGHERGAFTGAVRERKGRFELAEGGTLFLDEIGDITAKCQVALLRVLQEREFERVGGTRTLKVDVRVICATNRNLEALIAQGRFRQDLYYRLKGVMLELPPLRERTDDLPMLASHLLAKVASERREPPKRLTGEALALLARHTWPGNIRELENVLASAAIFAEGALIGPEAFSHIAELALPAPPVTFVSSEEPAVAPPAVDSPPTAKGPLDYYALARGRGLSLRDLRHEVEMQCIRRALLEAGGNISEAARLLGVKRSRLSQIVNSEPELKDVADGQ